jgi:hypothetical protein
MVGQNAPASGELHGLAHGQIPRRDVPSGFAGLAGHGLRFAFEGAPPDVAAGPGWCEGHTRARRP